MQKQVAHAKHQEKEKETEREREREREREGERGQKGVSKTPRNRETTNPTKCKPGHGLAANGVLDKKNQARDRAKGGYTHEAPKERNGERRDRARQREREREEEREGEGKRGSTKAPAATAKQTENRNTKEPRHVRGFRRLGTRHTATKQCKQR